MDQPYGPLTWDDIPFIVRSVHPEPDYSIESLPQPDGENDRFFYTGRIVSIIFALGEYTSYEYDYDNNPYDMVFNWILENWPHKSEEINMECGFQGMSYLHLATRVSSYYMHDVVNLLLEHGAKPTTEDVLCAYENGTAQTIDLLLSSGARPDFENEQLVSMSLFARAMCDGRDDVVKVLLKYGQTVHHSDYENHPRLEEIFLDSPQPYCGCQFCLHSWETHMVRLLQTPDKFRVYMEKGFPIPQMVQYSVPGDPTVQGMQPSTKTIPLMSYVLKCELMDLVPDLLQRGVVAHFQDYEDHPEMVDIFLAGPIPQCECCHFKWYGKMANYFKNHQFDTLKKFISKGFQTSLFRHATTQAQLIWLLEMGVDIPNSQGSKDRPFDKIQDLLLAELHTMLPKCVLRYYPPQNGAKIFKQLKESTSLDRIDEDGRAMLHYATTSQMVTHLVKIDNISPQTTDNNGMTPLHVVHNVGAARQLVKLGADIHAVDNNGQTPVFPPRIADHRNTGVGILKSVLARLKYLVKAGARLDVQDNDGQTPLIAYYKHHKCFNYLMSLNPPCRIIYPLMLNQIKDGLTVDQLFHDTEGKFEVLLPAYHKCIKWKQLCMFVLINYQRGKRVRLNDGSSRQVLSYKYGLMQHIIVRIFDFL